MNFLGNVFSSGIHFFINFPSGSNFSLCVMGLKILKYGAASAPHPAIHCQPDTLFAVS